MSNGSARSVTRVRPRERRATMRRRVGSARAAKARSSLDMALYSTKRLNMSSEEIIFLRGARGGDWLFARGARRNRWSFARDAQDVDVFLRETRGGIDGFFARGARESRCFFARGARKNPAGISRPDSG